MSEKLSPAKERPSGRPSAGRFAAASGFTSCLIPVRASVVNSPSPPPLEDSIHQRGQRTKVHWFTEHLERAQTKGFKSQLVVSCDGDQDHRRFRSKSPKLLEHCQTIQTGHFPVQDDQIEGEVARAESPGYPEPVGCFLDLITATTQRL